MDNTFHKNSKGFTLVELTVSLGLFIIIMFIATSAFLNIVNADRKARVVRVATDNLNLALEDMSRRIKTGYSYYCGNNDIGGNGDCTTGVNNTLFFTGQDGLRVKYTLSGTSISRTIGFNPSSDITSPEITITGLKFFVYGSTPLSSGDSNQPVVVILLDGNLGVGVSNSDFKIQTTVTQRAYDNQ